MAAERAKKSEIKSVQKKKLKGKLPRKTELNLIYKESDIGRRVFVMLAIICFLLALAWFGWFVAHYQLGKVEQARAVYESYGQELAALRQASKEFGAVEEEYSHYGSSYMNADELALQDRMEILGVINDKISLAQGLSKITLSGNTATVQLMSLELKEVSSIVAELEESPIVSYVGVDTANMDREGKLQRLTGSLVQAELTIEFNASIGELNVSEDNGSLTSQLAARKAALEAMG